MTTTPRAPARGGNAPAENTFQKSRRARPYADGQRATPVANDPSPAPRKGTRSLMAPAPSTLTTRTWVGRLLLLVALMTLVACSATPQAPTEHLAVGLQANPASIAAGASTTLSWSVAGTATSLAIDHGVGDVTHRTSATVTPASTTTYTLTAHGTTGSATGSATVVVQPADTTAAPTINAFSASPTTIAAGDPTTLAWSVGGSVTTLTIAPEVGDVTGLTSTTANPTSTTTYTLTASGPGGSTTATAEAIVALPPVAELVAAPTTGVLPHAVDFDGRGSTDPDGLELAYAWSFGDGNYATGAVVAHTYETAGTYTATLTVTSPNGLTDTATTQVSVRGTIELLAGMAGCAAGVYPRYVLFTFTVGNESSQRTATPEVPVSITWSVAPGTAYSASTRVYCGGDVTAGTAILRVYRDDVVVYTGQATGHGQTVSTSGTY